MKGGRDERFPRTRRCIQNYIAAAEQLEDRLFLLRIKLNSARRVHAEKPLEHRIGVRDATIRASERRERSGRSRR
jgi:hypothetical protein